MSRSDLAVAAGAEVRLRRLVGLDAADLERPVAVVLDPRHRWGRSAEQGPEEQGDDTATAAATIT